MPYFGERYFIGKVNVLNTSRPRQDGSHFEDNIFKWMFLNEKNRIPIQISLKYVGPQSPIDNKPGLVQVMAWRRTKKTTKKPRQIHK